MKVFCEFCAHNCLIEENYFGKCGIRKNINGKIVTVNFGEVVSLAIDPIEKKPLYHVRPGSETLSLALCGCNFTCLFCQNYSISQKDFFQNRNTSYYNPAEIADLMRAKKLKSVSYTYSEPTVWQDYMLSCAEKVKNYDGLNIMVTNGFFSEKSFASIIALIDAFNIDLKGDRDFYLKYTGGKIEPVLKNIQNIAKEKNKIVEVTTLVIESIHSISQVLAIGKMLEDAGVQVWHLTAFHSAWKMSNIPTTTYNFMINVISEVTAKIKISFVYSGNFHDMKFQSTFCPKCGKELIKRRGFFSSSIIDPKGICPFCKTFIYGLFSS